MRIIKKNTHVNLSTGERTDQIIGDGQRVDIHWTPLTDEQLKTVRAFEREMQEEVIPEIERVVRMRAKRAQESRQWLIG